MRLNDTKDLKKIMNFLEEYSWLLKKYNAIDIKNMMESINSIDYSNYNSNKKINAKNFLIGQLPSLLMDKDLFPKNRDIDDFAEAIGVSIRSSSKKSRDEMIGIIICSIYEEKSKNINDISLFIEKLTNNSFILNTLKSNKKLDLNNKNDWNSVIFKMFNGKF